MDDNATAAALAARFLLAARFPAAGLSEERWQTLIVGAHDAVAKDAVAFVNQPGVRDRLRMPGFTTWSEAEMWIVKEHAEAFDPDAVQRLRSNSFTQVIDGSHADVCLVLAELLGERAPKQAANLGHSRAKHAPEVETKALQAIASAIEALPENCSRDDVKAKAIELNGGDKRGIHNTSIDNHSAWQARLSNRKPTSETTGTEGTQAAVKATPDRPQKSPVKIVAWYERQRQELVSGGSTPERAKAEVMKLLKTLTSSELDDLMEIDTD